MSPSVSRSRRLIGGRWAISWQGYLIQLPVSVLFLLLTTPAFQIGQSVWSGFAVALASYLMLGVVLLAARFTVLARCTIYPAPIWLVALVGGVAWSARSWVIGTYLEAADLTSLASLPERLVFGFGLGAIIVPVTAWALASVAEFRDRRSALLAELVLDRQKADDVAHSVAELQSELLERVQRDVSERVQLFTEQTSRRPPNFADAEALEQLTTFAGRELARGVWKSEEKRYRLNWADVLRVVASSRPFAPWVNLGMGLFGFLILLRFMPWEPALGLAATTTAWALLIVWGTNAAVRRSSGRWAYLSTVFGLILLSATSLIVVEFWTLVTPETPQGPQLALLTALVYPALNLLGGIPRSINVAEERVFNLLRESISSEELRGEALVQEEVRVRKALALELHGTWSANLTAATMRLRVALNNGDELAAIDAMQEARRLLELDLVAMELHEHSDVLGVVQRIQDAWCGLVEITSDVDCPAPLSMHRLRELDQVITEGVSNAVRHGSAQSMHISVRQEGGNVLLSIRDDGSIAPSNRAGLGSALLDEVAPARWTLTPNSGGGSELRVGFHSS